MLKILFFPLNLEGFTLLSALYKAVIGRNIYAAVESWVAGPVGFVV